MPKIPTYDAPQVESRAIPNVKQSLDSRGAFGEQLGQGMKDLGQSLGAIAEKQDEAVTRERLSAYRKEANDAYVAFKQTSGRDAHDGKEAAAKQLDEIRKKYQADLSPRQLRNFDRLSEDYDFTYKNKVTDHAFKGFNDWQVATIDSSIESAQQDMAAMPEDAEKFSAQIKSEVLAKLKRQGLYNEGQADPDARKEQQEMLEMEQQKALTVGHKTAIEGMVKLDPVAAKSYFNKHLEEIAPSVRDDLLELIHGKERQNLAMGYADKAGALGSEVEGRKWLKENVSDPETRKAANALLANKWLATDRDTRRVQSDIVNEADLAVRAGTTIQAWAIENPEKWRTLTKQQRESLEKSNAISTDWDEYGSAEKKIAAGEFDSEADIRKFYGGVINRRDLNTLVKEWKNRGEISNADLRRLYTDHTGRKLGTGRNPLKEEDAAHWNSFKDYMLDKLKETRRPEDLDKWAARWTAPGEAEDESFAEKYIPFVEPGPETYGEAVTAGREDYFKRDIPEQEDPTRLDNLFKAAGVGFVNGEYMGDTNRIYWEHYVPVLDKLEAYELTLSDGNITAGMYLKSNGYPVTEKNILYIREQMK